MARHKSSVPLLLFLFTQCVYLLTMPRSIGYWDSPEFALTGHLLLNSHPPGSPVYGLITSFFATLFFFIDDAALISNYVATFFGSLIGVVVYFIVYECILHYIPNKEQLNKNTARHSGVLAALSLCFSHSFWLIATETEVYTLSFFFFVLLIYFALKTYTPTQGYRVQYLFLMCLLLGIVCGVHRIVLLAIIPIATFLFLQNKTLRFGSLISGIGFGVTCFIFFYFVLFLGSVALLHLIDVNMVNHVGMLENMGALLGLIVIFALLLALIYFAHYSRNKVLYVGGFVILFFLLGNTVNLVPVLRSTSKTPFEQGLRNSKTLQSYLNASQFGLDKIPILYGYNYNAPAHPLVPYTYGKRSFYYDEVQKQYLKANRNKDVQPNFDKKFGTFFPRMFNKNANSAIRYPLWTEINGSPISHFNGKETQELSKITFSENFSFFINYQVHWLYLRYLMWNFVGVQNNLHGTGNVLYGNWQSGLPFVDSKILGNPAEMPDYLKEHNSINLFYFIPLLFCVLGGVFLLKNPKLFLFFTLLFLAFGLGILLLINPTPDSILMRERDYIFIGSFMVLFLFVGWSFPLVSGVLKKIVRSQNSTVAVLVFFVMLLLVPGTFLIKGWDDHNRSNDFFLEDLAKSYLDACPKDAILITNGDNMTFPLQYLQEVKKYRTDVALINYDQLNLDWYAQGLTEWFPELQLSELQYLKSNTKIYPKKIDTENFVSLKDLIAFVSNESSQLNFGGLLQNYIPSTQFKLGVDLEAFSPKKLLASETYKARLIPELNWTYNKPFYSQNDLVLMDVVSKNFGKRPLCFVDNGAKNHFLGLENFFVLNGNVNLLLPVLRDSGKGNPKIVINTYYDKDIFSKRFNSIRETSAFVNSHYQEYIRKILRKNQYFLAQSLMEYNQAPKAKALLDKTVLFFPNAKIPYKQFAFAMGELYYRLGEKESGKAICTQAIDNVLQEIHWIIKAQPANSIINAKLLDERKQSAYGMLEQFNQIDSQAATTWIKKYRELSPKIEEYIKTHWPYF